MLMEAFGEREKSLHILVNNAGTLVDAPVDEYPEEGWDQVMDLNLKAPFFMTQKLLPLLRTASTHERPATVINIGSVGALKVRSEEHTSELQSLMRISYAVFCLKKKKTTYTIQRSYTVDKTTRDPTTT